MSYVTITNSFFIFYNPLFSFRTHDRTHTHTHTTFSSFSYFADKGDARWYVIASGKSVGEDDEANAAFAAISNEGAALYETKNANLPVFSHLEGHGGVLHPFRTETRSQYPISDLSGLALSCHCMLTCVHSDDSS